MFCKRATADTTVQLQIDWKKSGIDSTTATITAPEIKNFQPAKIVGLKEAIPVKKIKDGC